MYRRLSLVVEPVVRLVVDAAEAQRRTAVVALGGVVVDHVEDDLDARRVQRPDHGLELADLLAALAGAGVPVVRREEADRVVAPVVGQVALDQRLLGEELVHRQQLHRGDADPAQVLDHRRVAQPRVGAPLVQRDLRVAQRQAADVRLVDHRLVVRDARRPVVAPVEERVDDDVLRHERRAVGRVPPPRVAPLIVEQRLVPGHVALDGLGVGVEQQLGRGAAGAAPGIEGAVHPVAVPLARADRGQVPVPDETVHLRERDAGFCPRLVEQAQFDAVGDLREQREIRPPPVPRRPQWIRGSRPDVHQSPNAEHRQRSGLPG